MILSPLALLLFVGMGLVLGLLGGGGSILAVPTLVYVVGLGGRAAIATSLLVVGLTSVIGVVRHHARGNVLWATGIGFGLSSMVGGFLGGRLAAFVPEWLLLALFSAVMLVVAARMLRSAPRGEAAPGGEVPGEPGTIGMATGSALGLAIGVVTGLLGAGGGFLIVPALSLVAGLSMQAAIGTSLLVIVLNSSASLAGHLGHTPLDLTLGLSAAAAAALGALAGTSLGGRLSGEHLRRLFGLLVLVVALGMISSQAGLGPSLLAAGPWPYWAGGLGIGLFLLAFLLVEGRQLGVSTGFLDACKACLDPEVRRSWRLPFLAGIVSGGALAAWAVGAPGGGFQVPMFDQALTASLPVKAVLFTAGGFALGYGSRLAGGCTSGHSILGIALGSGQSLRVTLGFMGAGVLTVNLLYRVLGG